MTNSEAEERSARKWSEIAYWTNELNYSTRFNLNDYPESIRPLMARGEANLVATARRKLMELGFDANSN